MNVAIHLTERIKYRWPLEYWIELIHKLTKAGHEVYALSDEKSVQIHDKNPRLNDFLHCTDELAAKVIGDCEVFVGPPLKYYDMAKAIGVPVVGLLGATLQGEGVKSKTQCAGCEEKLPGHLDCLWNDELCMYEITVNDVLEAICRLQDSRRSEVPVPLSA